jgi:type IV secretory pathway VirB10-like protein
MRGPIPSRVGFQWSLWRVMALVILGLCTIAVTLWYFRVDLSRPKRVKVPEQHQAAPATFAVAEKNGQPYQMPVDEATLAQQKALLARLKALEDELAQRDAQSNAELASVVQQPSLESPPEKRHDGPPPKPRERSKAIYVVSEAKADTKSTGDPMYTLSVWEYIAATLENILVSEIPGMFTMITTRPVFDATRQHVLISQGTRIGAKAETADLLFGNERIAAFSLSIRLADGSAQDLGQSPIMDITGTNGLRGETDNHVFRLLWSTLAIGSLRGGQQVIQRGIGQDGMAPIAGGISREGSSEAQQRLGKAQDTRPTLTIASGTPVNILITKALQLPEAK